MAIGLISNTLSADQLSIATRLQSTPASIDGTKAIPYSIVSVILHHLKWRPRLPVMRCYQRLLLFFLCCSAAIYSSAQQTNFKQKKIAANSTQTIDSASLVPGTVFIKGVDSSYYHIDYARSSIRWLKPISADSIEISYRSFPFNFYKSYYRYRYDSIVGNFKMGPQVIKRSTSGDEGIFNFGNLNLHGSIGRSLAFGNAQDAVFNSDLNLQINGIIGDSIELMAAISDNDIPIQPDGSTQQLNEFDKILLQFKKNNWQLNLGDIDLRSNEPYFLTFNKRIQGIQYTQQWKLSENISNKTTGTASIAKGKFTQNIFQGQEGNQGPYKLQGANHEFFFIVLSGSEKVFINGIPMQRGFDNDYTINYNTAEITFTTRQMITKDSRIQVEFEYADRNYLNTQIFVKHESNINNKLDVKIAYYNNSDAKNSPINQTLDDKQKRFLANVGDSIDKAFYRSYAIDSFSAGRILYKRIDSVYSGGQDSVFVYSTHKDSARYSLNFVFVGQNNGNYIPLFNAANGKVYQWVAPINGVPQGSFEPAVFLVTPKQHQVLTTAATYRIGSKTVIAADAAFSNYNINKFSDKDKTDDVGFATKLNIVHTDEIQLMKNKTKLDAYAGYEWTSQQFRPVERIRSVEFARDWGLLPLQSAGDEYLPFAGIRFTDEKANSIAYDFAAYLRSDHYNAHRHIIRHQQQIKTIRTETILNSTFLDGGVEKGYFFRPSIVVTKQLPSFHQFTVGGGYSLEQNRIKNKLTDSIAARSFSYETFSFFLKSDESKSNKWAFNYAHRRNSYPSGKALLLSDFSHNYNFQSEWLASQNRQFKINLSYRELFVERPFLTGQVSENSLLSRVEYFFSEWNGFIKGSILYELGSGQEPRRDFSYVEVPAGKGEYTWIDYNGDGIQQLNEFEIALYPDEAKYIRIFTTSSAFIKAAFNQFNYNVSIHPAQLTNGGSGGVASKFLFQSSMQSGKKEITANAAVFNPFKTELSDTSLISINTILTNSVSFNRYSAVWGVEVTNVKNESKALLTYGLESRRLNNWIMRSRYNFLKFYSIEYVHRFNATALLSPAFANRNYQVNGWQAEPRISYTYLTKFRLTAAYSYLKKANSEQYGGETMQNNIFKLEGKFSAKQSAAINGTIALNNISYQGATNTPVSYILLDGLQPGKNTLWNIDFTKRILNNLELSFQYEGRSPATGRTVHIGRAAIRAIL